MKRTGGQYVHADVVNRWAMAGVVVLVILAIAWGATATGSSEEPSEPSVLAAALQSRATLEPEPGPPPSESATETTLATTSTTVVDVASSTSIPTSTSPSTTVSDSTTSTTTRPPPTTTTTRPPTTTTTTTTLPPTTTTLPPTTATTTTTTTTLPPTTTTTTLPPTTTTTAPPTAWYAILDAEVSCQDGAPGVTWFVYDPRADWSNGWQLVIDGDNRGVFVRGTIVTANGGPATAVERVEPGSHTLTVARHWERLPGGGDSTGQGFNSITVKVDADTCA